MRALISFSLHSFSSSVWLKTDFDEAEFQDFLSRVLQIQKTSFSVHEKQMMKAQVFWKDNI